jgi:hypothetical protein
MVNWKTWRNGGDGEVFVLGEFLSGDVVAALLWPMRHLQHLEVAGR